MYLLRKCTAEPGNAPGKNLCSASKQSEPGFGARPSQLKTRSCAVSSKCRMPSKVTGTRSMPLRSRTSQKLRSPSSRTEDEPKNSETSAPAKADSSASSRTEDESKNSETSAPAKADSSATSRISSCSTCSCSFFCSSFSASIPFCSSFFPASRFKVAVTAIAMRLRLFAPAPRRARLRRRTAAPTAADAPAPTAAAATPAAEAPAEIVEAGPAMTCNEAAGLLPNELPEAAPLPVDGWNAAEGTETNAVVAAASTPIVCAGQRSVKPVFGQTD
mmetsp:Transcript_47759/g.120393  ORF Transcript_47759/g.120393 Transcript_47759/m.120393 type:complete len:274 (+) Transcript_47759:398-1219(+)